MYYVYEWFVVETGEVIYVGKGCRNRYRVRKHNRFFNEMLKRFECDSRIVREFESEQDAFAYEFERVNELRRIGQCVCNIYNGGTGGTTGWWTDEMRDKYSKNNAMKSADQRARMSQENPMKDKAIAEKVNSKKRVRVLIDGHTFKSIKEASIAYHVSTSTIGEWCNKGVTSSGLKCERLGEYTKHNVPVIVNGVWYRSKEKASRELGISAYELTQYLEGKLRNTKYICEYGNQQPSRGNADNSTTEGSETNG